MNTVYLLLGGNLDNRSALLDQARKSISQRIGRILQESSIYESEAWGFTSSQRFLNQVIRIETLMSPSALLNELLKIEKELGRTRDHGDIYTSRLIDIDILFFNEDIINEENLIIPHPRIHERMFTLLPLNELAKKFIHPLKNKSIGELVVECNDPLEVYPYHP